MSMEGRYRATALLGISYWIFGAVVVVIALGRELITEKPHPLDNDMNRGREIVAMFDVVDSAHNGFRLSYATVNPVSKPRLYEITRRPHVAEGFKQLRSDALEHFGSLLYTDIYDFAEFAVRYDSDKDVEMHSIFVCGQQKMALYVGPNPTLLRPALWINPGTEQGVQHIGHDDIYLRRNPRKRVYRYWKCSGNNAISSTDERFSHFSEDERLW